MSDRASSLEGQILAVLGDQALDIPDIYTKLEEGRPDGGLRLFHVFNAVRSMAAAGKLEAIPTAHLRLPRYRKTGEGGS